MSRVEPSRPGTYALLFRCPATVPDVRIGALGSFTLRCGYYVYIGSAFGPGGIDGRLRHHLRPVARPRWHVDWLRPHVTLLGVLRAAGERELEHRWAAALAGLEGWSAPVPRFGASDCRCEAHLFRAARRPRVEGLRETLGGACYAGAGPLRAALGMESSVADR